MGFQRRSFQTSKLRGKTAGRLFVGSSFVRLIGQQQVLGEVETSSIVGGNFRETWWWRGFVALVIIKRRSSKGGVIQNNGTKSDKPPGTRWFNSWPKFQQIIKREKQWYLESGNSKKCKCYQILQFCPQVYHCYQPLSCLSPVLFLHNT